MKREHVNYTLVGVAVIVALVLLLGSLAVITGRGGASSSYFVTYKNVTGLKLGAPVFYEGYRIGQVSSIDPVRADKTRYKVELSVRRDWPIPNDSVARLLSTGLLGDVSIAIKEGAAREPLKAGSDITGQEGGDVFAAVNELAGEITALTRDRISPLVDSVGKKVDSLAAELDRSTPTILAEAQALLKRLNEAAVSVNDVLSPQNRKQVSATLENVRALTADLKGTQSKLDGLLGELQGVAAENRPALRSAVTDLAQITAALAKRIDAIAHNLESSSRNFNEFTREVRQHPNRLLITPKEDDVPRESDR